MYLLRGKELEHIGCSKVLNQTGNECVRVRGRPRYLVAYVFYPGGRSRWCDNIIKYGRGLPTASRVWKILEGVVLEDR